jgi:hypothetical protein
MDNLTEDVHYEGGHCPPSRAEDGGQCSPNLLCWIDQANGCGRSWTEGQDAGEGVPRKKVGISGWEGSAPSHRPSEPQAPFELAICVLA